jgi:hypothetical protein
MVALDQHSPAIPGFHPFRDVGQGYRSFPSSDDDLSHAWVFYSEDGNVGVGFKEKADFSVWPLRS